jgi:hypothetical protein
MPNAAFRPVTRSTTGTPMRTGVPPRASVSPLMLIMPTSAWIAAS